MTSPPDAPRGPLDGIVVADFSRVLAGPLASMFLADLGATVIKVERRKTGDDTRAWGPPYVGETSTYFTSVNRNKKSIALDLATPADLEIAHKIVGKADVFVENFRPGALARFGLDSDSLAQSHPGLVYASVSGFGSTKGAHLPGYDFVVQAAGGLMSITGERGGPPMKVGVALVDVITGLHATIGILASLQERQRSGLGQHVEVNLLSSLIASLVNQGASYINGAGVPAAMGNEHPSIAPYETLETADRPLAVAVGNDTQFMSLTYAIGRGELAEDPRFTTNASRVAHRMALIAELEHTMATQTAEYWADALTRAGVPCSAVNDIAGAISLATTLGLDPVTVLQGPGGDDVSVLTNPIRFDRTPPQHRTAPPDLGAHDAEVRAWLDAYQ